MFALTGPQKVEDKARDRVIWHPSRWESRYKRAGKTITVYKEMYSDIDDEFWTIPAGISLTLPHPLVWDETKEPLTEDELAEMLADVKAGYPLMDARVTVYDGEDSQRVLYEADPKAIHKPSKRTREEIYRDRQKPSA